MTAGAPKHVLSRYKVLDFTQFVAGATATVMMAELGAEVVKVELAPSGDPARTLPVLKAGRSGYFVQHNLGKQSICVDVKHAEGLALIKQLVPRFDVLVENFAPGVMGRLGLDYKTVSALNPGIVMCSISSYGQDGPLAHEPGYDWLGAAYAGILDLTGFADGPPMAPMLAIGDVSTGVHAFAAIACALLYREHAGHGQYLDISLLDSYFHYHDGGVQMYSVSGGAIKPKRAGLHSYYVGPAGIFKGKENYLVIFALLDHQFAKLCEAMGRPELASDPRFLKNGDRVAHVKELVEIIEGWLATTPSDEAAMRVLREHYVPTAPVLSVEQAVNHPHLRQRGTVRKVRDRILGEVELPGHGLRFSEFPKPLDVQAPTLGEHNEQVLSRYLGYTPDQVRGLENRGVLRSGPT
jgi:crotonobetainyl-CoA:carnitine CoA-transferase CaiB-like acyl-CoA transferase